MLHDGEEEEKVSHFLSPLWETGYCIGLINTPSGTPLLIFKSQWVCRMLTQPENSMPRLWGRTMIVRDANCFHHFEDGVCFCKDYWWYPKSFFSMGRWIMGNGPPFLPILSMLHIVDVDSRYVNVYCPIYFSPYFTSIVGRPFQSKRLEFALTTGIQSHTCEMNVTGSCMDQH